MEGIVAHHSDAISKIAEDAATVFPGDHSLTVGLYRVPELRSVKGIGNALLDGNNQTVCLTIIVFDDTV